MVNLPKLNSTSATPGNPLTSILKRQNKERNGISETNWKRKTYKATAFVRTLQWDA
jgi:hypothetical protein